VFDRLIRLCVGMGFVFFDYIATSNWELLFFVVGSWGVLTSFFGWCPFYRIIGIDTCPAKFKIIENENVLKN